MTRPLDFGQPAPAGWRRQRLKDFAGYVDRGVAPEYADADTGVVAFNQKCVRPDLSIALELGRPVVSGSVPSNSPARLRAGDIVINSTGRGTLGRAGLVRNEPSAALVADGHVTIARVRRDDVDPRFVSWVLATEAFYQQANACLAVGATNQTELNREALRRMAIALPTLDEQRRIADYLGAETARIDELIAEQEWIKHLLAERLSASRLALILGPAGVGQPGWKNGRLKSFVRIARGRFTHRPRNDPALYGGVYPFIQTGDIANSRDGVVRSWSQTLNEVGLAASRLAPNGTLVMAIAANIGDVARLGFDACFPDSIVALTPRHQLSDDYVLELIRALRAELIGRATLNTQLNINVDRIGDVVVSVPPIREQGAILTELRQMSEYAATVTHEVDRQSDLLREHRQAFITTAVTQGIDGLPGVG